VKTERDWREAATAKEGQEPPEAGGGQEGSSLEISEGAWPRSNPEV
jgi:hypothetical protein